MNAFNVNARYFSKLTDSDEETMSAYFNYYQHARSSGEDTNLIPLSWYPIVFLMLILYGYYFKWKKNMNSSIKNEVKCDFIFVTTYYKIVRAVNLEKIAGDLSYIVIFLPSFNYKEINQVYSKTQNYGNYLYPFFGLKYYFSFLKFYFCNLITLKRIEGDRNEKRFLYKMILQNYIYKSFLDNYIRDHYKESGQIILDYNRSIFIPIIQRLRKDNIPTIHMQHGMFIIPNSFYFPLYCSHVICCSEREKEYYLRSGVDSDNILVLGAPLQTLNNDNQKFMPSYDILILLTTTRDELLRTQQQVFLDICRQEFSDLRYLVRFRPASEESDKKRLNIKFDSMKISNGTSLSEDLHMTKSVVSFSFDALFEIQRCHIPYMIVSPFENGSDDVLVKKCSNNNYRERLHELINGKISTLTESEFYDYVGPLDIEVLRRRFTEYIVKMNSTYCLQTV